MANQEKTVDLRLTAVHAGDGESFSAALLVVDHLAVLRLEGEFDLAAVEAFAKWAEHAQSASRQVTVDLSGITFIDSSGLNSLLRLRRSTMAAGGGMTIRNPSDCVQQLFAITGLSGVFPPAA
jgi:anti-sigma B factor antagonist